MNFLEALSILQLGPNYTDQDLKDAYRARARKAHPDHNGCAEDFKVIKAAYEYLKHSPRKIFKKESPNISNANLEIVKKVSISFEDACVGCIKTVIFDRHNLATQKELCPICFGRGWIAREKYPIVKCNVCKSSRPASKIRKTIRIPAGILDEGSLRFNNEGHSIDGTVGALRVIVSVKKSNHLIREGQDIVQLKDVRYSDLLLCKSLVANTIHGDVKIDIPYGSFDGDILKIKGRGIKSKKGAGSHIVKLRLIAPNSLTDVQRRALEDLRKVGL